MHKVTVLYNHPGDESAFEAYYETTHLPLAANIPHIDRAEFTKFIPGPVGSKPAFYRMAELYFTTGSLLMDALASDEGRDAAGDIPKFASGDFHFLIGKV